MRESRRRSVVFVCVFVCECANVSVSGIACVLKPIFAQRLRLALVAASHARNVVASKTFDMAS